MMVNFTWFYLLLLASAASLFPTPPDNDDFYNPPSGYENQPNGAILKSRPVPHTITNLISSIKIEGAWQLLVKSEDSFNNPNAIVTTILKPFNADPEKVVSYQVYEDSASIQCSPSYALQSGSPINTLATSSEIYFIAALLNQGYYVNIPDYEGPKSAFCAAYQSGYAALNSIRAALASGETTGISNMARSVLWGYSGGTIPSSMASVLISSYSPDIVSNVIGVAVGGFVSNISATAEICDGKFCAGIISNALGGLSNEYPAFKSFYDSQINPLLLFNWNLKDKHCLLDSLIYYFNQHFISGVFRYIRDSWATINQEPIKTILESNSLVYQKQLVPKVPIFIYHGTIDQVVPFVNSFKTFNQWCEAGVESAEFAEDLTNGHITETIVGAPAALTWIIDRFNGVPPVKGCQHTQRLNNFLYPNIAPSILTYFKSAFDAITGMKLGGDVTKDQISIGALQGLINLNFNHN
ncbi:unnamed protein product [Candida verbasci]|uniref:Triacylglycerol lipase n=1 Tax=Candida verbasci TaxID=1227364 RepID=A0A9W4XMU9_9ASCO|nr:unnamed protein product [Candida verbasci]